MTSWLANGCSTRRARPYRAALLDHGAALLGHGAALLGHGAALLGHGAALLGQDHRADRLGSWP